MLSKTTLLLSMMSVGDNASMCLEGCGCSGGPKSLHGSLPGFTNIGDQLIWAGMVACLLHEVHPTYCKSSDGQLHGDVGTAAVHCKAQCQ